ncbi:SPOR domain-containing protein [Sulfitobacter porphyrae]|uniref:SPOR domain-containing protein n=1 Tax=Sulfitobacter porphyrae TaxID=1246864 RepID=A0ABW2B3A3_9RHOB
MKKLTNLAGAMVSLALIAGIGVWGYKLLVRDVSGIPVVRAASGEMRIRPEDPGGELADHQGLSVNVIAAEGSARPADQLRLAPRPVDLSDEDQVVQAAMVTDAPQPQAPAAAAPAAPAAQVSADEVASALASGEVDDLVAKLTDGVAPLTGIEDETDAIVAEVTQDVVAEVVESEERLASVIDGPGVRHSLRPKRRPATRAVVTPAALTTQSADTASEEVDAANLPAGTRLAQLGAFDSAEVAREQWDQLQNRFSAYLGDKKRVVQKASSGGRVFYRLRAMGFEDIADARRFCSALVAENADCIPVVTR